MRSCTARCEVWPSTTIEAVSVPSICRALLALVLVLVFLVSGCSSASKAGHRDLSVTAIDVGQGDSIFIETPSGRTVLIDAGGKNNSLTADTTADPGIDTVVPYLRYRGVDKIDMLIITHPHGDHVGGMAAVLRAFPVGIVMDGTTVPYHAAAYQTCLALIHARGIKYVHALRGMIIDFHDGVSGVILNPPADLSYGTDDSDRTINNYSVVLRLTYGATAFMLDGDAEVEAEDSILRYMHGRRLEANVLKCGHHGSRNASSNEWLNAVAPTFGIISCGRHNVFGHPHIELLQRLASHNVRILRTDENGAVECVSDGKTVTVHCTIDSAAAASMVPG